MTYYQIDPSHFYGQVYLKEDLLPSRGVLTPSFEDDLTLDDIVSIEASFSNAEGARLDFGNIDALYDTYLGTFERSSEYPHVDRSIESLDNLPVDEWSGEDCYNWAEGICRHRRLDSTEVSLSNFRNTTGAALRHSSVEDFCSVVGDLYGAVFYQDFRTRRKRDLKARKQHRLQSHLENDFNRWPQSEDPQIHPESVFTSPASSSLPSSIPSSTSPSSSSSSSPLSSSPEASSPVNSSVARSSSSGATSDSYLYTESYQTTSFSSSLSSSSPSSSITTSSTPPPSSSSSSSSSSCHYTESYQARHSSSSSSSPPSSSLLIGEDLWGLSQEEFQDLDRYIPADQDWNALADLPADLLQERLLQCAPAKGTNEDYEGNEDYSIYQELLDSQDYRGPPESANCAVSEKVKTSSRKGERGPKIWEFLMRLLVDPSTNPELIRWDDISKGTFVLTQPAVIAQLWGARAKRPNLSANNFARALRYHYSTSALTAVSERHYMYKCGPKAIQYLADVHSFSLPATASLGSICSNKEKQRSIRKKSKKNPETGVGC